MIKFIRYYFLDLKKLIQSAAVFFLASIFMPSLSVAATQNLSFNCSANLFFGASSPGDTLVVTLTSNCILNSASDPPVNMSVSSIVDSGGNSKSITPGQTYVTGDVFRITVGSSLGFNSKMTFKSTGGAPLGVYSMTPAVPTISSITPASGSANGGTLVTLNCGALQCWNYATLSSVIQAVSVNGVNLPSTAWLATSAPNVRFVTPPGVEGPVDVVITNMNGSSSPRTFTYLTPPPTVTSISPNIGPSAGGQTVTITGTNFTNASSVTINGVSVSSFTVTSNTTINAVTPAGALGTNRSVVVTTPRGSNSANTLYSYVSAPTVSSVTPNSGITLGGTNITITGTRFYSPASVTIGGVSATNIVVVSDTSITATTPAGILGTASVLVSTASGSNAANTLFTFTSPSTDANLSGLTLSSGALTPTFASSTIAYTQSVANAVSSITVTPTVNQANATVTVNGTAVASGSASGSINLNVGANTITTVVTAQDGTTTQTYTTTVTRAAALIAQASFLVTSSPNALNATTTTSELSTTGGSGTGSVTYAMTTGTCALSGATVTAGTVNETCTVTATKAADSTYLAATASVNITVNRRASLAAAATDPSVSRVQEAQWMQSKLFVQTQVQNVTTHLDAFKLNFNLQPSYSGVSVITPSLGPMAPVFYKVKDVWLANRGEVGDASYGQVGMKKAVHTNAGDRFYADGRRTEEMDESDERVPSTYTDGRKQNTHSFWSVGTVDTGLFKTGDNQEVTHKFRVSGLTLGLDYKVGSRAIVGAALGLGQDSNPSQERGSKVKSNQHSITAYGVFGLGRNWLVDGLLGHSRHSFTGNRTTSDGAAQLGMNRRTGDGAFASGSISTIFSLGPLSVAPFVRQDITHIRLNQYNETGDADYALGFGRTKQTATATSAGVHFFNDIHLARGKLTTSLKLSANRMKTGALSQDVYYADVGAAGGIYTLQQKSSQQNASSLSLGVTYSNKAGDAIDIGWMGAVGANQYKHNRVRLGLSFGL